MNSPVFVVGTGRSGTHTIMNLFRGADGVLPLHEGNRGLNGVETTGLGHMNGLNIYLYHNPDGESRQRELDTQTGQTKILMDHLFRPRAELYDQAIRDGTRVIDVNRHAYNFILYVYNRYPTAKFIHLVRDPATCIQSWMQRDGAYPDSGPQYASRRIPRTRKIPGLGTLLPEWYMPGPIGRQIGIARNKLIKPNRLLESAICSEKLGPAELFVLGGGIGHFYPYDKPIPKTTELTADRWDELTRIEKIAWFWKHCNQRIIQQFETLPTDNYLTIRIEDLDSKTADSIVEFCGVDGRVPADRASQKIDARKAPRSDLTSRSEIESKAGWIVKEIANRLGYMTRG